MDGISRTKRMTTSVERGFKHIGKGYLRQVMSYRKNRLFILQNVSLPGIVRAIQGFNMEILDTPDKPEYDKKIILDKSDKVY